MRVFVLPLLTLAIGALPLQRARAADPTVAPGAAAPSVGDLAPSFTLAGSDGRTYKLSDFQGKQVVVIAWFAKAFTGG